jgi:hypothetical protein
MADDFDAALATLGVGATPAKQSNGGMVGTSGPVWQIPADVQRARDGDRLSLLQNELSQAKDPTARAGLQREIARTQQSMRAPQAQSSQPDDFDHALASLSAPVQSQQQSAAPSPAHMLRPWAMPEVALHEATGMLGQIAGGWAGILSGGDADKVRKVSDALTYEPRTESGKAALEGIHQGVDMIRNAPGIRNVVSAYDSVADAVSPAAGAAIRTLPTAITTLAMPEARGALASGFKPLREIGQVAEAPVRVEPSLDKPRIKLNVDGSTAPVRPLAGPQPGGAIPAAAPGPQVTQPVNAGARQPVSINGSTAPAAASTSTTPLPVNLGNASPELQQKVAQLVRQGQPINHEVLARHVDAESLPVPIKLTEGQATLDPDLISTEMNGRGKSQPTVSPDFYNQQGKALTANLEAIRSNVAPDVSAVHPTDMGQTLIDRYKAMDEPIVQDIDAKYQALRDANGGQFPVDAGQLLNNVRAALRKELLSNDAPASQMSELERLASDGNMTMEDFLSLRRNLGNVARTATDGNTRTAAGIMTRQLEALPLSSEASALKPLADQARVAARERFSRIDADPAYKAAVNDGVPIGEPSPVADKFVRNYVTGDNARLANIKQMKANLGNDPVASQTIAASTLDHLQQAAKVDGETGKFLADGYGKRVTSLSPKLGDLVGQDAAQQLQQVARVSKYTSAQPRGSYVNNANTLVGRLSEMGKAGVSSFAATKTLGASKVVEKGIEAMKAGSAARRATSPGAGISIKDMLNPK